MPRLRLLAALAAIAAAVAIAQPPPPEKKDPQSSVEPKSAPGEGQQFLAKFVGTWEVKKSFHPRTGDPVTQSGTCVQELTHGGRFLKSEFTFEKDGEKTTGTGTIGFDAETKKFTSTWIDSRSTRMSFRQGKDEFDGKQIVLHAAALGGEPARASWTVTKLDGEKIVHTQYGAGEGGKERVVMELVMTKKADPKGK